jgi:predicted metal-dependent peptidase
MKSSPAALDRISAARTALVLDHPFFGSLALRLKPEESTRTKTMATDGRSLFYHAPFLDTLSHEELVGTLAHEVMHPAMLHHARREGRDPLLWNHAADYAINPLIVEAGFKLPDGALLNAAYQGQSAEQIYAQLQQRQQEEQRQSAQSQGQGQPQPGPGDQLEDLPGAVLDSPEPAQDAAEWQVAVKQATQAAKMMGRLPGSIARELEAQAKPHVDWRSLLRRFVQQCSSADYSWRMPNRRFIACGLYLPELRSESLPPIVVAIDTSGSIGEAELAVFAAELRSIVDECQPEATHVIYCDDGVQSVETFARGEQIELHATGGGGTNFCPVFDHVEEHAINPACLIYLTDGMGRYPETPSEFPTLWAMTSSKVAPWGETIQVEAYS